MWKILPFLAKIHLFIPWYIDVIAKMICQDNMLSAIAKYHSMGETLVSFQWWIEGGIWIYESKAWVWRYGRWCISALDLWFDWSGAWRSFMEWFFTSCGQKWKCCNLTKYWSLAALEVVKMTTSNAASDQNQVKMMTFICFSASLMVGVEDDVEYIT